MFERSAVEQFYYTSPAKEWTRLERHRIELAVTMRALTELLPPAPACVLDIGGGPGCYAIALAEPGMLIESAGFVTRALLGEPMREWHFQADGDDPMRLVNP